MTKNTGSKTGPESLLMRDAKKRSAGFQRDLALEDLLQELESILSPIDTELRGQFELPEFPPLLLLGNPRSGTSLLMQLLAQSRSFAVPTNLLSRFNYAPYLGAKIQLLLCDAQYDKNGEMTDLSSATGLSSRLGKTKGALAPSEFYHFWRRYIPAHDIEYLSNDQLNLVDLPGLLSSMAAIESVFQKPFAAKALMLQYNLDFFSKVIPGSLYVYIRRKPQYIMQSILLAREAFYEDRNMWWSVKPREYADLCHLDVHRQIAGQVFFTHRAIQLGLTGIPQQNKLVIDYEELCRSPAGAYGNIVDKYSSLGVDLPSAYTGPASLQIENTVKLHRSDFDLLMRCYAELGGD